METYLLGLDSGSTATKAVIFDTQGRTVAVGCRRVEQRQPRARHVERDMHETWAAACGAIRDALGEIPAGPSTFAIDGGKRGCCKRRCN
jgi:L-xylulokinase